MASEMLPPAQPAFVLRGHHAQIHALHFTPNNKRLLTADADGWVVSWNLAYKRPVAVWRAHTNAVLGLGSWGPDRVITHGRDNKLLVWLLSEADESQMEKTLPVNIKDLSDGTAKKQPWLLFAMPVNAMNYCSFAMCRDGILQMDLQTQEIEKGPSLEPILLTVPNALDSSGIDIFQFPSRRRAAVIHKDRDVNTGMVMALAIETQSASIQVAAGYESGHTMVFVQKDPGAVFEKLYCAQSHSQPILSLTMAPTQETYLTSSADAHISTHPLPFKPSVWTTPLKPIKTISTKHAGQQGLSCRSDDRIFATAGWDAHVRVYSRKTMKEVAVLKWHKEGCYTTAFAAIMSPAEGDGRPENEKSVKTISETTESDSSRLDAEGSDAKTDMLNVQGRGDQEGMTRTRTHSGLIPAVGSVQQRRQEKAQTTHWLAAGSKDGKISLWDIY